jgi:hypothetical protein
LLVRRGGAAVERAADEVGIAGLELPRRRDPACDDDQLRPAWGETGDLSLDAVSERLRLLLVP